MEEQLPIGLLPKEREELIQDLNRAYGLELGLKLTPQLDAGELEALLAEKLNALLRDDFSALVQLLYRVDVSESKLREMLRTNSGEDAGRIMARLVMERQWQKIETRRRYSRGAGGDEGAEGEGGAQDGKSGWKEE
jgi:hypothetical protein